MKLSINPSNHKELQIDFKNDEEYETLLYYMTPKMRGWRFKAKNMRYARGKWDGSVNFVRKGRFIPIQLWQVIYELCKKNKFEFEFEDIKDVLKLKVDKSKVIDIYERAIKSDPDLESDEDQIKTIIDFLSYKHNKMNLSTSYGKTLIIFVACVYLMSQENDQILITTPKPSLSNQMYSDFVKYSKYVKESQAKFMFMTSGTDFDDYEHFPILMGNFQLIYNKDKEHFERFTASIIDEVHRASAKSYKTILKNCINLKSTRGATGTLPNDFTVETYSVICASGFTNKIVKKKELMDKGRATKGKVIATYINPLNDELSLHLRKYIIANKEHIDQLNRERDLIRESQNRLEFIINKSYECFKKHGNGIVFFKDVKNRYGMKIAHGISSRYKDVSVFYIDQSVKQRDRDEIYAYVRKNPGRCIVVVSYDIMSTGISINNLCFGLYGEPVKSEITVGQVIGRFMRLFEGKDYFYLYDIIDVIDLGEFSTQSGGYKRKYNYYHKWFMYSRKKVYNSDDIEILENKVDINNRL